MSNAAETDVARWWEDRVFRAVTLYPWATMDADAELERLAERGVNTVFVVTKESDGRVFYDSEIAPQQIPNRDLLADIIDAADTHDIAIIPSIFTLCDKYLVEQHPHAVQIAREGTEICYPNVSLEWMHWVCPNHAVVRDHLQAVAEELAAYDVDGIQFTHFEFQPIMNDGTSYRSCFCEECISRYETRGTTDEPDGWVEDRCQTVTDLLSELIVPFNEDDNLMVNVEMEAFADLETAVEDSRETLGVDQLSIADLADVLTLRTAHVDLDIHPLWIRDVIRSLRAQCDTPVVPSIRTSNEEAQSYVPDDELVTAIQMALNGGSSGVSLFSTGANIGSLSPDQWETVAQQYVELDEFERKYGCPF